jgi:phosphoribosyl 1,2-cyclic phosphodiesterase
MRVVPLASGSRGNATLVEFDRPGHLFGPTRLLVDAGIAAREIARRLEQVGVTPASIRALLLSHEHEDHARGAASFSRRHGVPVLSTAGTLDALDASPSHFAGWHRLVAGRTVPIDGVEVEPFTVSHDAADPLGFVVRGAGLRFGIATDLGQATAEVVERLRGCHVLMVESNHDDRMLAAGPYPRQLKRRVAGPLGHLSNEEAGSLVAQTAVSECRVVVLAHLSEQNNTEALARRAVGGALRRAGFRVPEIRVACSGGPTPPVAL